MLEPEPCLPTGCMAATLRLRWKRRWNSVASCSRAKPFTYKAAMQSPVTALILRPGQRAGQFAARAQEIEILEKSPACAAIDP